MDSQLWICTVIGWLGLIVFACHCQFVTTPRNSWVYVGESVTLECTIENAGVTAHLQVWREHISVAGGRVVASRDNVFNSFLDKYEIIGQYHLKIKEAELSDGGRYSCEDARGEQVPYYVELVVLEADPVLASSISSSLILENTQVRYTCALSYQGRLTPVMQWTNSEGQIVTHTDTSTSRYVETSVAFRADANYNKDYFTCRTYFGDVDVTSNYEASNQLTYSNTIQTEVLDIHYKPQQTRIIDLYDNTISRGSNIFAGTQFRCKAESNPPVARYEWKNTVNSQVLGTDAILSIGEELVGSVSLQCAVTNYMGASGQIEGTDSVVLSFNVIAADNSGTGGDDSAEKPLSNGEIIGLALGVAAFLAVVIVVTIICVHKRKYRRKKITEEYVVNEDGEEELRRRHIEIVEPAGLEGTAISLDDELTRNEDDNFSGKVEENYSDEQNNNTSDISDSSGSSRHDGTDQLEDDDNYHHEGQEDRPYTNNKVVKFADEDSDELPPYIKRGNLEDIL